MNGVSWLFLYTPLPWFVAMYVVAYRHDLARIARPFRDVSSPTEWWSVCKHLGLVGADVKEPREPFLHSRFISSSFFATVILSSLWAFFPFSLAWYLLCAIQAAAALPLFAVVVRYRAGPFPFKPYRDFLPYPRLGTRVGHLTYSREAERNAERRTAPAPARIGSGGVAP